MIDVIDHAFTVTDFNQRFQDIDDVFFTQRAFTDNFFTAQTAVELHAANGRQVVALGREKQILEQVFCRFFGRRLTGAHHAVDLNQSLKLAVGRIGPQGFADERPAIQFVGVQRFNRIGARLGESLEHLFCDFGVTGEQYFAGLLIDNIFCQRTANHVLTRHFQLGDFGFLNLANVTRRDTTTGLGDHFAVLVADIKGRDFPAQTLGDQFDLEVAFFVGLEGVDVEEHVENFFRRVTQRTQQNGRGQFAATVDADVNQILRIELEVEP